MPFLFFFISKFVLDMFCLFCLKIGLLEVWKLAKKKKKKGFLDTTRGNQVNHLFVPDEKI